MRNTGTHITYAYDTLNRLMTLGPPSVFSTGSFGSAEFIPSPQ